MNTIITNITIGNWYLVREKPTKISPANVVWAFRDGCSPMPLTDNILESHGCLKMVPTATSSGGRPEITLWYPSTMSISYRTQ